MPSMWLQSQPHKYSKWTLPKCSSEVLPIWLAPDGGGAGKPSPGKAHRGTYPVREGSSLSWCQKSHASLIDLHVWLGVCVVGGGSYQGELEMFSFFLKKSISIHPVPGKTTIPHRQSPSPSVLKNTHLPRYFLFPWVCFKQQLITVWMAWGTLAFISVLGLQAPVVWHRLNIQIVNVMTILSPPS